MKKIKKVLALTSFSLLLMSLPLSANAASSNALSGSDTNPIAGAFNIQNDSNSIKSEIMTFDELVSTFAKDNEVSIEQARGTLLNNYIDAHSDKNDLLYSNMSSEAEYNSLVAQAMNAQYATYQKEITLPQTSAYKPSIAWYCEISEGGGYRGILKVLNTSLIRTYNGTSKTFSGSLYTKLESANTIHYILNGDFYNNGTMTIGAGISLGIGESNSISFSLSAANNHYTSAYVTGDYNLYK